MTSDTRRKTGLGELLWEAPTRKNPAGFNNRPRIAIVDIQDATKANPASILKSSGTNPTNRGQEKLRQTLHWLATFVWSSESIILKRLGISRRGWMVALENKRLVIRVASGTRGGCVWVLTKTGLELARSYSQQVFSHYPAKPERRQQTALKHDLALQTVVIDQIRSGVISEVYNGAYFSTGSADEWLPDCIAKIGENLVGFELERHLKNRVQRDQKLLRIIKLLNRSPTAQVLFISHIESCLTEYTAVMLNGINGVELAHPDAVRILKLDKDLAQFV